ncbi:MAG: hypothetical protein JWM86_2892 [Thermoleophilia bacterium]|nr:hypothetical protein [Thermoleophilia bacterium]
MRNVQTWVVTIAALAIGGGMFAFLVSTPDMGRRVPRSQLGFRELQRDRVDMGSALAANHHRHVALLDEAAASATSAARGWMGALAQSRGRRVTPAAARFVVLGSQAGATSVPDADASGTRRTAAFVRWADDLPRSTWRARMTTAEQPTERGDEPDATSHVLEVRVTGTATITVAQAASRSRVQRVPVTLVLAAPLRSDALAAPKRWTLIDVETSGSKEFLRAYSDPIVLRGRSVDVVAPAAAAATAAAVLPQLEQGIAAARSRSGSIDGASSATAWLLERRDRAKAVVGRAAPTPAWAGDPRGVSWSDSRGELVVDLAARQAAAPAAAAASLRHAATHVALRSLETYASGFLVEGVVRHVAEGARPSRTTVAAGVRVMPELLAAFGTGSSGIARRIVAAPDEDPFDGASPTQARLRYEAADATVSWVAEVRGERALARLLASLERGDPPAAAIERVLEVTPRQLERAVARWTRARDTAAARAARPLRERDGSADIDTPDVG